MYQTKFNRFIYQNIRMLVPYWLDIWGQLKMGRLSNLLTSRWYPLIPPFAWICFHKFRKLPNTLKTYPTADPKQWILVDIPFTRRFGKIEQIINLSQKSVHACTLYTVTISHFQVPTFVSKPHLHPPVSKDGFLENTPFNSVWWFSQLKKHVGGVPFWSG